MNGDDDNYFKSYEDLEIHMLMLQDAPRTEAYRSAILNNSHVFKDKIILDVGAGTGILSMFCAKAGAAKVYAVEASDTAHVAKDIVEKNGFSSVVEVIQAKAEELVLPEQVDIIVSEWMGFYLFHESMLDSVLLARDQHLKPDGIMWPSQVTLYAAACSLDGFYRSKVDYWNEVYGFDMGPARDYYLTSKTTKPEILVIDPEEILTEPTVVATFELAWTDIEDVQAMQKKVFLSVEKKSQFRGVCLWFDAKFETNNTDDPITTLSTSPRSLPTHWKQSIIVLPTSVDVEEGEIVGWDLHLTQSDSNKRHYDISLALLDPAEEEHPVPCGCKSAKCELIAACLRKEQEELGIDEIIDIS